MRRSKLAAAVLLLGCLAAAQTPAYMATLTAMRKIFAVHNPQQRIDAWVQFISKHQNFFSDPSDGATNAAFDLRRYIQSHHADAALVQKSIAGINTAFPKDSLGQSIFESMTAKSLLQSDVALGFAITLDRASLQSLHHRPYLDWQKRADADRQAYEARTDKFTAAEPFNPADAEAAFQNERASRYALLGQLQQKLGQPAAALQSYQQALQFHSNMDAFRGVASLEKAKGNRAAEFQALCKAELTGHLGAAGIAELHSVYAVLYPGRTAASLGRLLDEQYQATFHSPVHWAPYARHPASPPRAVLAELFTGAGCVPCISPDLAMDAALQRYSRRQLVLLVHHDNAPDPDPLANAATDVRDQYYSTGGSTPHLFLDGQEVALYQGPSTHAQKSFDGITRLVDRDLARPATAALHLHAFRDGDQVQVTVDGTVLASIPHPLRLHLDLVSQEVSYSGENSLRLQPMVVRATAWPTGFALHGRHFTESYSFSIPAIEKANLAYYGHFKAEVLKRTHGFFHISYREHKNLIDPSRLAVAAFLQDAKTHSVLQSTYAAVPAAADISGN